jgi:hypothetical protein
MRQAGLLVAGPLAVLGALAALAAASGGQARPSGLCIDEPGSDLPGEARELPAGKGLWSAWLTYPPRARETITVLWRAEGFAERPFALSGVDAYGHRLAVEFGPSPVLPQLRGGGLQWPRQGREWGSRLLFSHPGCWRLELDAGGRPGTLTVWVRR